MKELALISHLLSIDGIGAKTAIYLRDKFGSAEEIFNAEFSALVSLYGINETLAKRITKERNHLSAAIDKFEKSLLHLRKSGGQIVSYWDDIYPELLRNISQPPVLLYLLGNTDLLSSPAIAVVGTRKPTRYGLKQADFFACALAENNLTVTSGLARGIDTRAHKTAITQNGNTIAVLGAGLDYIYPPENKSLFYEIAEKGLIVTEYPFGTKPDAVNFPRRNRIISGLSLGTLIIETKITGGALVTASYALEQGREVFAVPGNVDSEQSMGTNRLIQRGEAKLVLSIEDILEELRIKPQKPGKRKKEEKPDLSVLDVFEQKIYECLSEKPLHLDKIAQLTGMNASECSVYLLNLELKGFIVQQPGKYFVKA